MVQFYNDSIFWVEVEKIKPNPYQPRREFDEARLRDLSESIRQYGILQPLVVTRKEYTKEDGGLMVEYELISGERRLRASKLAGLSQVPVLIRSSEENDLVKLELAIIENLQREDLNAVDRARAFQKLAEEFHFKHIQIAQKVGKSREYVSNSLRILALPEEILNALSEGKISEGHTRPILMLTDRPEEQLTLFKEIMFKKLTVREAEAIARRVAYDRVRKKELAVDPEIVELEEKLAESFGTRVKIERKETGGKILIDFFSNEDLREILQIIENKGDIKKNITTSLERHISQVLAKREDKKELPMVTVASVVAETTPEINIPAVATPNVVAETSPDADLPQIPAEQEMTVAPDETVAMVLDDRTKDEITKHQETEDEDLYSIKNFSL